MFRRIEVHFSKLTCRQNICLAVMTRCQRTSRKRPGFAFGVFIVARWIDRCIGVKLIGEIPVCEDSAVAISDPGAVIGRDWPNLGESSSNSSPTVVRPVSDAQGWCGPPTSAPTAPHTPPRLHAKPAAGERASAIGVTRDTAPRETRSSRSARAETGTHRASVHSLGARA